MQQRGLAGPVRADQHGRRAGVERERERPENGRAAHGEAHVLEHDRQIAERRAHVQPA
jgi:hypothetical protein